MKSENKNIKKKKTVTESEQNKCSPQRAETKCWRTGLYGGRTGGGVNRTQVKTVRKSTQGAGP